MGKPTGFLEYKRETAKVLPPKVRIANFNEFRTPLSKEKQTIQGARCMACGVPFCQSGMMLNGMASGCPLHNLVPETNDLVYTGNWKQAYLRLSKTHSFPEFTSRVCPALCEAACTCNLDSEPVSTKENERAIIETAWQEGWVKPQIPRVRTGKTIAVVGSGPSGLAAAQQLNRRGHSVTVYERADRAGGLLMYGIPNMKLDKHLVERRIKLLEEAGVTFELNSEIGHKISSETLLKQFDAIALCTGSTVPRDLTIPGRELQGIHFAKDYLHSVTKSFLDSSLQDKKAVSAKGKDVIVIGGGDTGTDCVATAIRQGCRSVKQIEIMPCLPHSRTADNPWPEMPRVFKTDYGQEEAFELYHQDPRDYCIMSKEFIGKNGKVDKLRLCQIDWQKEDGRLIPVEIAGTEQIVSAQLVLLAMGFIGTETQLFDEFKFARSEANTIAANDNDYMTSIPGIFAAGDARRGQSLVVWAIAEGRGAAAAIDKYLTAVK